MNLSRIGFKEKYDLSSEKQSYQIGRHPSCDITFTSKFVSRAHCEITRIPPHGCLLIKNKTDRNITYVDEIELKTEEAIAELRVGSQIGLGVPLNFADTADVDPEHVFLQVCIDEDAQDIMLQSHKEKYSGHTTPQFMNHDDIIFKESFKESHNIHPSLQVSTKKLDHHIKQEQISNFIEEQAFNKEKNKSPNLNILQRHSKPIKKESSNSPKLKLSPNFCIKNESKCHIALEVINMDDECDDLQLITKDAEMSSKNPILKNIKDDSCIQLPSSPVLLTLSPQHKPGFPSSVFTSSVDNDDVKEDHYDLIMLSDSDDDMPLPKNLNPPKALQSKQISETSENNCKRKNTTTSEFERDSKISKSLKSKDYIEVKVKEETIPSPNKEASSKKVSFAPNNNIYRMQPDLDKGCQDLKEIKVEPDTVSRIDHTNPFELLDVKLKEEENSSSEVDDDDDDLPIMYSQRDEVVIISSDDEESESSMNSSYRPGASSPEFNLGILFDENSFDGCDLVGKGQVKQEIITESDLLLKKNKLSLSKKVSTQFASTANAHVDCKDDLQHINNAEQTSDEEDDYIFPKRDSPAQKDTSSESDSTDSWWPVLSQNFDEDTKIKLTAKEIGNDHNREQISLSDDSIFPKRDCPVQKETDKDNDTNGWWPELSQAFDEDCSKEEGFKPKEKFKDLKVIIKRVEDKSPVTSTKLIDCIPPPLPKKLKRKKSQSKELPTTTILPSTGREENVSHRENSKSKVKETPHSSNLLKRKKKSNLRKSLLKSHDFGCYKAFAEKDHDKKFQQAPSKTCRPNSKLENAQLASENISIRPKSSCSKGIAKMSGVSRSQKLAEFDLFSSSDSKPTKPNSYKIPKRSSDKSDPKSKGLPNKRSPFKHSPLLSNENKAIASAARKDDIPNCASVHKLATDARDLHKETHPEEGLSTSPSTIPKPSKNLRVHFPAKDEELVSIRLISPRRKKDCFGPTTVYKKETFFNSTLQKSTPPPTNPNQGSNSNIEYEFIYHICNWNFDWLLAYDKVKQTHGTLQVSQVPPVVSSPAIPTLILYDSYDDYKEIFSNLMYYETWEHIYKDWKSYFSTTLKVVCLPDRKRPFIINKGRDKIQLIEMMFITLLTKDMVHQGHHPSIGSLVVVKEKTPKAPGLFGYVNKIDKRISNAILPKELKTSCPSGADSTLFLYILFAKPNLESFISGRNLLDIRSFSYVRPAFRSFEALCLLPSFSICPYLLKPLDSSVFLNFDKAESYLVPEIVLNQSQQRAVCEISAKCCLNRNMPKISLIHGPPGSGKTKVISSLIVQITRTQKLKKCSNRRILLCAPSNSAVDDLTLRILNLNSIKMNVVRVGVRNSIDPVVKKRSFDILVREAVRNALAKPKNKSIEAELKNRSKCANEATDKYLKAQNEKSCSPQELQRLKHRMIELVRSKDELVESCKKSFTASERREIENQCRKKVLQTAEVITTTLTSCLSGVLTQIFSYDQNSFVCCIVDEAGQCKETDTLLPFMLGVQKLVLVGDHLQLPATVLSEFAHGQKLHQSLFERLYHYVVFQKNQHNLVHSLDTQYRMHEDIACWPSQHFYMGTLQTDPTTSTSQKWKIHPYLIFDLEDSHEESSKPGELHNISEANLIALLIETLKSHLINKSIGILTPYLKQKINLEEKLSSLMSNLDITVSTVDNFQGQERDVIICSFVRANSKSRIGFVSHPQRLNVALTRARYNCFIVANLKSFAANEDWKSLISNGKQRQVINSLSCNPLPDKAFLLNILLKNG